MMEKDSTETTTSDKVVEKDNLTEVATDKAESPLQNMIDDGLFTGTSKADTSVTKQAIVTSDSQPGSTTTTTTVTYSKFKLNILILGTIGSGKATLANKIANEEIFVPNDDVWRDPKIRNGQASSGNFAFLLIDTFGAFDVTKHKDTYTYHNIQREFEKHMRDGVNLIIVTIRKDRSSPDEIKILNYIIQERFSENVGEFFALVITGCDEVGLTKRDDFLVKMRETTEDTKFLFDYALKQKGVKLTAFPNLDEAEDDTTKVSFKKKIEASEEQLKELLKNCKTQLYFSEIFNKIKGKEKNWSLLPSKEISPKCTQS